jgi:phospholipase/carboxylesterase
MSEISEAEARYLRAAMDAAVAAHAFLRWMEDAAERLAPERSAGLAVETEKTHGEPLRRARAALDAAPAAPSFTPLASRLAEGFAHVEAAYGLFSSFPAAAPYERIPRILSALHEVAEAQQSLYPLRQALPPFHDFWRLAGTDVLDQPPRHEDGSAPTGVVHVSRGGHHGGFALYVPEHYTVQGAWPVIVALHGGSGNGRDFLWTWLREAKSLGYILISPSSVGDTWGDVEDRGLLEILAWLGDRYHIDVKRVLLTGLSDGATFTLLYGLAHPAVYRALAPVCGVLHPANQAIGNIERARGMPIYLVHGRLDFLFPVDLARMARETLTASGAALEYRELPELSHTYPRSENVRILKWFAALPPRS